MRKIFPLFISLIWLFPVFSGTDESLGKSEQWVLLKYRMDAQNKPMNISVLKASCQEVMKFVGGYVSKHNSIPDLGLNSVEFKGISADGETYHWIIKFPNDFLPFTKEGVLSFEPLEVNEAKGPYFVFLRVETDEQGFIKNTDFVFIQEELKKIQDVLKSLIKQNLRIAWNVPRHAVFFVSFEVTSGTMKMPGWLAYIKEEK